MKVVLFCGGYGTRLRDYSNTVPKPMVPIGYRPILWHVMKYYAHFGHTEFVLCLGWQSHVIKDYFLSQDHSNSTATATRCNGLPVTHVHQAEHKWTVTLVDTGCGISVGERLRRVRPLLEGESTFLANYSDGLTDLYLPELIDFHTEREAVTTFLAVKPQLSFHTVQSSATGKVQSVQPIRQTDTWINGGYFVMSHKVFDYLSDGEDLIEEPFERMIHDERLYSMPHLGFWSCIDTYKEKQAIDEMYEQGVTPWQVWSATPNTPVLSSQIAHSGVTEGKAF